MQMENYRIQLKVDNANLKSCKTNKNSYNTNEEDRIYIVLQCLTCHILNCQFIHFFYNYIAYLALIVISFGEVLVNDVLMKF